MPTVLQFRRGTTAQNNNFTGAAGEVSVDTDNDTLRVHDGSTAGGSALLPQTGTLDLTLNAQADLRFGDSDSSNYVAFQAPATVSSNVTWTLPAADASVSGYALVSDSAGTLSWAAAGATISQDASTNTDFNIYFASSTSGALTSVKYDTALNYNPSTETLTATNFDGVSTSAKYADVAEKYESDAEYEPGTVISIGGEKEVTQSTAYADSAIVGVVSTNPAYLMNSDIQAAISIDLALTGRVPCRVVGNISKGDVLTSSSTPGVATKLASADFIPGCILGKALEDYNSNDPGVIEVLVGKA